MSDDPERDAIIRWLAGTVRSSAWMGALADALERSAENCSVSSTTSTPPYAEAFHAMKLMLGGLAEDLRKQSQRHNPPDTEGQILTRPTVAGWWWVRIYMPDGKSSGWDVQQVAEQNGELGYKYDDGEFLPVHDWSGGWRFEWAGPLTPPDKWKKAQRSRSPNVLISKTALEAGHGS